ncbi:MAG: AraC family transcriptional regulator [Flavobacterium sp.]|uniref:helix-turn-helix domain-containing protein n=1 Tax=Flavobacterium sp. TaxID=239 RepID=UPI0026181067|nr:AraC family transcriptional regulator [Flavobacterium sp.]MDD5148999.1 AraC family transcriptional regulator [Flavobacterium sp.]
MIFDKISNWLTHTEQYFFTYQKGFFFLSYLSNSPQLVVESSKKLPFIKVDEENQMFFSDNPFVKTTVQYMELEKGLWVLNSRVKYKNNVSFKPIYDSTMEADYYCFTINIVENNFSTKFYEFDNFKIEDKSISFLKPKKDFINCHFKGSFENQYIIYFNEEWAKNNLLSISNLSPEVINLFEDDTIGFVNYKFNEKIFEKCIHNFNEIFKEHKKPNLLELKKNTYKFFDIFINSIDELQALDSNTLSLKDRRKLRKIENFLIDNIYNKFPGIVLISNEYQISPTKLKKDFKDLFGVSIFKYFQAKQMDLALDLLKQNDLLIKEIANKFQYENMGKFSKAFQNHHGFLPSKVNS